MGRVFDTPPRGDGLRALRTMLDEHHDCLGLLPARGRRVLELRAGLRGGGPASRRTIARRLGTSPAAALQIERSSLRRLLAAGDQGRCAAPGAAPGAQAQQAAGGLDGASGTADGEGAGADGGGDPLPGSEVLADAHEGGPGIDLGDGSQGPAEALLFLLLTLLALLAPVAAAARVLKRPVDGAAATATDGRRPLLFLDVDGVIALDPLESPLPPGHIRASPHGLAYVPDRTGRLVRQLATRFDIVWASGWEHRVNTSLMSPLGLHDELPVLTFGRRARMGSAKWKIKPVDHYAGDRPAAWVDDHLVARHRRWAAQRDQPTLLVPVDPHVGLTPDHVEQLLRWAERVEDGEGGIRTLEGRCRP